MLHPTGEVEVYFPNDRLGDPCTEVFGVTRRVDRDQLLTATLQALLAGPTEAEQTDGYDGWFTEATADALLDAHIENGTVHVTFTDLRELIPNASSSCGSSALLAQLDTTLPALDGITTTRYTIADQTAFYTWLQLADPDAGWTVLPDFEWPVEPASGSIETTGPVSPEGPIPARGWSADGLYDVTVTRDEADVTVLRLLLRRWVRCDQLPDADCRHDPEPDPVTGEDPRIIGDPSSEVDRSLPIDALRVVVVPLRDEAGTGGRRTLEGEPDAGRWPPGDNGLYGWTTVTFQVRDGRPILYLWAGPIAG